jgi:hypothetical protein
MENNQLITESEVESKLNILVKGQTNNSKQLQDIRNDLQRGFIGLALRNQELVELNNRINTTTRHCCCGIKSNQKRTPRKRNSKAISCESETFTQA